MMRLARVLALPLFGALALGGASRAIAQPQQTSPPSHASAPKSEGMPRTRLSDVGVYSLTDLRLFSTAAAISLALPSAEPPSGLARSILAEIKVNNSAVLPAIAEYVRQHKPTTEGQTSEMASYLSLGLVVSDPPAFELLLPEALVPEDVRTFLGFLPLLRRFFSSANVRAVYNQYLDRIQSDAMNIFSAAPAMISARIFYLHTAPVTLVQGEARTVAEQGKQRAIFVRDRHRKMFVIYDPLAPRDSIIVRNDISVVMGSETPDRAGDDLLLILGPTETREVRELGRAYTRYLLDPILERSSTELIDRVTHKPTGLAQNILALLAKAKSPDSSFRNSVTLIVRESLVYAIEAGIERASGAKLRRVPDVDLQNRVQLAKQFETGAVLVFHFYEALKGLESAGIDFRDAYASFLRAINFDLEARRPEQFEQIRSAHEAKRAEDSAIASTPLLAGASAALTDQLVKADHLIAAKEYDNAEKLLQKLQIENPGNARILYGLAEVKNGRLSPEELSATGTEEDRASAQERRLEDVVLLYQQAIAAAGASDLWIKSRSYFEIAKIYEFKELLDEAIGHYTSAILLGEIPNGSYREALKAKARLLAARP